MIRPAVERDEGQACSVLLNFAMQYVIHRCRIRFVQKLDNGFEMPRRELSIEIDASPDDVFDLVHDYDQRLEWDTMLSKACLLEGAESAGINVRSLCVGKWDSFYLPMETVYVSFRRGRVAAVKLVNRPWFFAEFAASIRHQPISMQSSKTTYIYSFVAKPKALRFVLEPIIDSLMARQVERRLNGLKKILES